MPNDELTKNPIKEVDDLVTADDSKKNYDNEDSFDAAYSAMRLEQSNRTKEITAILVNYKNQQSDRSDFKKIYKRIIFWIFLALVIGFAGIIGFSVIRSFTKSIIDNNTLVSLITNLVAGFSSIISILVIIVKYVFPPDEESNFNDLVKDIIKQDTERIKNDTNSHTTNKL